jgi:hypothetical protein
MNVFSVRLELFCEQTRGLWPVREKVEVELCLFFAQAEADELGDELGVVSHNDFVAMYVY